MNLDDQTKEAIRTALQEERRASTFYAAVLDRFGPSRVIGRLSQAERRHASVLARLLGSDESTVPNVSGETVPPLPNRFPAALRAALELEEESAAMYDRLLDDVSHPDVRAVFVRLREASTDRHHAALERMLAGPHRRRR